MLLVVVGCCWLLQVGVGCCSLLLVIVGCCCLLLVAVIAAFAAVVAVFAVFAVVVVVAVVVAAVVATVVCYRCVRVQIKLGSLRHQGCTTCVSGVWCLPSRCKVASNLCMMTPCRLGQPLQFLSSGSLAGKQRGFQNRALPHTSFRSAGLADAHNARPRLF